MLKFAFVVLFFAQALARPSSDAEINPFLVGGTPAAEGQFPFAVSLRFMNGTAFCGGSLISNKHILSSAQCMSKKTANMIQVGVGSVDLKKQKLYPVEKIVAHSNFENAKFTNDVAVLTLKTPLTLGGNVQTISLLTNDNLERKNATAMGWGRTSTTGPYSDKLMFLPRPILTNEDCISAIVVRITPGQICTDNGFGMGTCYGDGGSPLLYKGPDGKNYVAGIASFGVPCAHGYPDVFTRVTYYNKWITDNMK